MTQMETVIPKPTARRYDVEAHLKRGYHLTLRARRRQAVLYRPTDGRTKLVSFEHAKAEAERLAGVFPEKIQCRP